MGTAIWKKACGRADRRLTHAGCPLGVATSQRPETCADLRRCVNYNAFRTVPALIVRGDRAALPHAAVGLAPSAAAGSARSLAQSLAPRASSGRSILRPCNYSPLAPLLNCRLPILIWNVQLIGGTRKPANLVPCQRMANKDIRAHPMLELRAENQTKCRRLNAWFSIRPASCAAPNDSGSPAGACAMPQLAKEPLPPRIVIQCTVASTPADTGAGLAGRLVL